MTYEEFQRLTVEEMQNVPDEELPEVPQEKLDNFVTKSKAMRKDGVLGWEVVQAPPGTDSRTCFFPIQKVLYEELHQLDPTDGLYKPVATEPSMEEEPIGIYGRRWMEWMSDNYPERVDVMIAHHQYLTVARSVDKRAEEYYELLEQQFEKENPRPSGEDYFELVDWHRARHFYADSDTMRDVVLHAVTTP